MENQFGVFRDLSKQYAKIKQRYNEMGSYNSSLNDSSSHGFIHDNRKIHLIEHDKQELSNWHLPPKYVELYDHCNDLFKELEIEYTKLQEEEQKRVVPSFDENENKVRDNNIQISIINMTNKLKECEDTIKKIKFEITYDKSQEQIKGNMHQNLLKKLSDFSNKLRLNEKIYMEKYQQLNSSDFMENQIESQSDFQDQITTTKINSNKNILEQRKKDIDKLLKSMYALSELYKYAQNLVVEQGTILDRIDENIESSKYQVKRAHKELVEAEEDSRSSYARKINLYLTIIVFILGMLVLFKYF